MIIIGTLFHSLIAAGLAFAFLLHRVASVPLLVSLGFALKELGEAKYKIPGSVKTLDKNLEMLKYVFTTPEIVIQWSIPGLVAFGVCWWLSRRSE